MRLALILLCSCGAAQPLIRAECVTASGMTAVEPTPEHWCETLQATEDAVLKAYLKVIPHDPRFNATDSRRVLSQYKIIVRPETDWTQDRTGIQVIGETVCWYRTIYVGRVPPNQGALGHEMAHAIQDCKPTPPLDPHDPDHSNWGPIYEALSVRGGP